MDMASFSLEFDGFCSSQNNGLSNDPFENAGFPPSQSDKVLLDPNYSDISDDDFEVPCSQKRLHRR